MDLSGTDHGSHQQYYQRMNAKSSKSYEDPAWKERRFSKDETRRRLRDRREARLQQGGTQQETSLCVIS